MRRQKHLALALSLVLALGVAGLVGCSSGNAGKPASDEATEKVEKEEDVLLGEDDASEFDVDEEAKPVDEPEPEPEPTEETQHVGAEGIGFVDIPASWIEFHDAEGGDDLQWCDGTPYTIVTLNVIDLSDLDESQRSELTLEQAATNILSHMVDEGADQDSIGGAHLTLGGRDALQAYGRYADGSTLVFWLVPDDAGNSRYVAAEGTDDTIMDAVGIVEDSYQL